MKSVTAILLIILFLSALTRLSAQKVEIEKRIPPSEFPASAAGFLLDSFPDCKQMRYYMETNSAGSSYEAKFEHTGTSYSVEFDLNGQWQDTETLVELSELDAVVQNNIASILSQKFDSSKIKKLQKQRSSSGIRYEAVIKGRKNGKPEFYEFLFDAEGKYLSEEIILFETLSNDYQ